MTSYPITIPPEGIQLEFVIDCLELRLEKGAKSSNTTDVEKVIRRLENIYILIHNMTETTKLPDYKIVQKTEEFILYTKKLADLMHRDGTQDISFYLEQLNKRVKDNKLDLESIKWDMFSILRNKDLDKPHNGNIELITRELQNFCNNLTKIVENYRVNPRNKTYKDFKATLREIFKNWRYLSDKVKHRQTESLITKLKMIYDKELDTEDGVKKAKQITEEIVEQVKKDTKKLYWIDHRRQIPRIHISSNNKDVNRLMSEIDGIYMILMYLNTRITIKGFSKPEPTELTILYIKCEFYFSTVAKIIRHLGEISKIYPLNIFSKRIENRAFKINSAKDVEETFQLLQSTLEFIKNKLYKAPLDNYIVGIKKSKKEVLDLIEEAKYMNLSTDDMFTEIAHRIKEYLLGLAARVHVRGFTDIDNELQDVLDDHRKYYISNASNLSRNLKDMKRVVDAVTRFLKINPNL